MDTEKQLEGLGQGNNRYLIFFLACCMWYVGLVENSLGPNIPALQTAYQLDTHQVARLVLPHAIGFLLGSIGVSYAIQAFSVRGTQLLSSVFWMTSALLLSLIPPFLLVWIATFGLTVGCGLTETLVSSLTGQLATSPRMLSVFWGIIHIGCLSAPLITGLLVALDVPWNYYYVGVAVGTLPLVISGRWTIAGLQETGKEEDEEIATASERSMLVLRSRAARICLATMFWAFAFTFLFFDWLPDYLLLVKKVDPAIARFVSSGISAGIATARILPSFVEDPILRLLPTVLKSKLDSRYPHWQEYVARRQNVLWVQSCCILLPMIMLWSFSNIYMSGLAIFLSGYFWGPITPHIISTVTADAPKYMHSTLIGSTIAFGFVGAAIMPYAFGLLSDAFGLQSLPLYMIGCLIIMSTIFLLMPDPEVLPEYEELELEDEAIRSTA